jgi:hypothetical protein
MRSFFLEAILRDVLYNISKIQLEIIDEASRICFAIAAAPCSGSN